MGGTKAVWFRDVCRVMAVWFLLYGMHPMALGLRMPQFATLQSLGPTLVHAQDGTDDDLLSATLDADSTDPFIVAKAAELGNDPAQIFAFVRDEIRYESYRGSLRGARGTLWSQAGNALDQASLLIALLRASGVPARYVQGTLPDDLAQQLILSMFPPVHRVVGLIPAGIQRSDPTNDPQLLAETRQHFWVEFNMAGEFTAADPTFEEAEIGQTFTTAADTFAEVPDTLRHKVTIRLKAEFASSFPATPFDTRIPLNETFSTVELVGKPLSIGHFVNTTSESGLLFGDVTHTYSPYILIGQNDADISDDPVIRGEDYQEFLSNFPLSSQFLTGVFLEFDVISPDGMAETFERTLVDRIGFAIRQNGGRPEIILDASAPPALTQLDSVTTVIAPGQIDAAVNQARILRFQELAAAGELLITNNDLDPRLPTDASLAQRRLEFLQEAGILQGAILATQFAIEADLSLERLEEQFVGRAYFSSPRIILSGTKLEQRGDSDAVLRPFIDVRRSSIRAIPSAEQRVDAAVLFNFIRGLEENIIETALLELAVPSGTPIVSAFTIIQEAHNQNIALRIIDNVTGVERLDISAEAQARIRRAVLNNNIVLVPTSDVAIAGRREIAWYQIDGNSGETLGVTEDGGHQSIAEYGFQVTVVSLTLGAVLGFALGIGFGGIWFELNQFGNRIGCAFGSGVDRFGTCVPKSNTNVDLQRQADAVRDNLCNLPVTATGALGGGVLAGLTLGELFILPAFAGLSGVAFVGVLPCGFGLGFANAIEHRINTDPPVPALLLGPPARDGFTPGTEPGVIAEIVPDELFTVPVNGAQLPAAFRVQIQNLGPREETFDLTFPDVPPGFEILSSLPSVTIPPGEIGEVGVYLRPIGQIGAAGAPAPFSVSVASTTNPDITATDSEEFTIPEVHGVTLVSDPVVVNTSPGNPVSTTLTLSLVGNVPEANISLELGLPSGLTASGLTSPVALDIGESTSQVLTLTPAADTPLNTSFTAIVTATFGPGASPQTATTQVVVQVVIPGAQPAANAAVAASTLGRPELDSTLSDLSAALTNLFQDPSNEVFKSQVSAQLDSLTGQLDDPLLTPFVADLTAARDAIAASTPDTIAEALNTLNTALTPFADRLADLANHNFELALQPNSAVALPETPARFELSLRNTGTQTTTYTFSLSELPPG